MSNHIEEETPGDKKYEALISLMIASVSLGGSFLLFMWYSGLPSRDAMSVIARNLFPIPHTNGFYGNEPTVYMMVYVFIILALGISGTFSKVDAKFSRCTPGRTRCRYKNDPCCLAMIVFMLVVAVQCVQHNKYFYYLRRENRGMAPSEKKSAIFGFPYTFAEHCKRHLKGKHTGRLVTDMDIQGSEGMTVHRTLAYHLYPIRIRFVSEDEPPDCLVFLGKKNAVDHIPEEFVLKYQYDENNLLAVRKDL